MMLLVLLLCLFCAFNIEQIPLLFVLFWSVMTLPFLKSSGQVSTRMSSHMWVIWLLAHDYIPACRDASGSSCPLPVPDLESALSSISPDCFQLGMVFRHHFLNTSCGHRYPSVTSRAFQRTELRWIFFKRKENKSLYWYFLFKLKISGFLLFCFCIRLVVFNVF